MLVNANCPYAHRDTVSSPSPCTEEGGKARVYALRHGAGPLWLPAELQGAEGLSLPTAQGGVDSVKSVFATRSDQN